MRKLFYYVLFVAAALGLAACSMENTPTPESETPDTETESVTETEKDEETDQGEGGSEDKPEQDTETMEFDEQKEEMIEIEGMEEPILLNLYNNEEAPFLTYVPEDLLAEEESVEEGQSYKFYANYEGERLENINLHIYIFADQMTEEPRLEDEDSIIAELLGNMEEVSSENKWYEWSIKEFQSPEGSNYAMLGNHNEQYFIIIINSEPLYSEGFVPRARKVIEHIYWKVSKEYLVQEKM